MTKNTGSLKQFRSVACRENTLLRDDPGFSTKRMDPRKYENWTCVGSPDQFSAFQTWN